MSLPFDLLEDQRRAHARLKAWRQSRRSLLLLALAGVAWFLLCAVLAALYCGLPLL